MIKKNWSNPEVINLNVTETKEDTKDIPHVFVCQDCGHHHYISAFKCIKCGSSNIQMEICPKPETPLS